MHISALCKTANMEPLRLDTLIIKQIMRQYIRTFPAKKPTRKGHTMPTFRQETALQSAMQAEQEKLKKLDIKIMSKNLEKPWGGYFVIDDAMPEAEMFCRHYFPTTPFGKLGSGKLSPKLLFILPGEELSWQHHHRRAEIWQIVRGCGYITTSLTDEKNESSLYCSGSFIHLGPEMRHMASCPADAPSVLIIAEFWIHTDPDHPSDEDDIVRVSDKYRRKKNGNKRKK